MKLISTSELTRKSSKVRNIYDIATDKEVTIIDEMLSVCQSNNGIAIAAPQVGIFKRFFLSLIDLSTQTNDPTLYINPNYKPVKNSKIISSIEGCISYNRGESLYSVERYNIIEATWYYFGNNSNLKKYKLILQDDIATIFQHETDHLFGITIATKGTKVNAS